MLICSELLNKETVFPFFADAVTGELPSVKNHKQKPVTGRHGTGCG